MSSSLPIGVIREGLLTNSNPCLICIRNSRSKNFSRQSRSSRWSGCRGATFLQPRCCSAGSRGGSRTPGRQTSGRTRTRTRFSSTPWTCSAAGFQPAASSCGRPGSCPRSGCWWWSGWPRWCRCRSCRARWSNSVGASEAGCRFV